MPPSRRIATATAPIQVRVILLRDRCDSKKRSMVQTRAVARTMASGAVQATGHSPLTANLGWFIAARERLNAAKSRRMIFEFFQ
jgi:hypothetical protein